MREDARVIRKLAWDIIPCQAVPRFLPIFGLVPGSEEGCELEHRESHARLDRLAPLAGYLTEQASRASQVVTAAMLQLDDDDDESTDEIVETVATQNASVIYAGVCAILAQLIDDGIMTIGGY